MPEVIKDVPKAVRLFIKELTPDIPPHRLELVHTHRALKPPCMDGLPQDAIVKPHFYNIKEEVMRKACSLPQLSFQGHPIQIFTELSPSTIQRWRSFKPLLATLSQKEIKYWCFFSFGLKKM